MRAGVVVWPVLALVALPAAAAEEASRCAPPAQLIERYVAALGGREALAELESLRLTGSYAMNSDYVPATVVRQRPDLYRFDRGPADALRTRAFDGTSAWSTVAPEEREAMAANISIEAEFDGPLVDFERKGHTVEPAVPELLDSGSACGLRLLRKGGDPETWYFDPHTHLPALRRSVWRQYGREWELSTYYSEYRSVAGVRIPHLVEHEFASSYRMLSFDSAEANPELSATAFERGTP